MSFIHPLQTACRPAGLSIRPAKARTYIFLTGLLLLALGAWHCTGRGRNNNDTIYESGLVKRKKIRLPDGTGIIMNAGTVIRISPGFNKENRDLQLEGEALFDIAGDAGKPFVVHTKHLQILVLGTRFKVDAYPQNAGEEVDLLSGKLKVMKSYHSDTDNEPEVLQAGEMVMINRDIDLMEKENFDIKELKGWDKEN